MTTTETPIETTITTIGGTDEDRGMCHILTRDLSRTLCNRQGPGEGPNGERPSGVHTIGDTSANPCDGCGYPRCPKCEAAGGQA